METSFYSEEELKAIPFKSIGKNVLISRKSSIYTPGEISIGNHVRIDDFCLLSGKITIGSYIHVSAYAALYGKYGIILEDYSTISARVLIYSQNDDYSGEFMTNPMVPEHLTHVTGGLVKFEKYSIIGAGSMVLPSVTVGEGAVVGAMSLVTKDMKAWTVNFGIPAIYKRDRKQEIKLLVKEFESRNNKFSHS
jgi:acetyltransferase-like isoleucine patch superfamily enzyme